jgi:HicA toxin of bacterial toxin-antitoxin,
VFATPVPKNLAWAEIEPLLDSLGAKKVSRDGSAVSFALNGARLDVHRPHPQKEAKPYVVRNTARFLTLAGIKL